MPSKTPNFDKLLDECLENLAPHERSCRQCSKVFDVFAEDIEFYHELRVPPPTLCPDCRSQRRMGFIKRLPKFYRRSCNAEGHKENIISAFPHTAPISVYDFNYYFSDNWEATDYEIGFDFQKPFFEQFRELVLKVPHVDIPDKDSKGVNSPYVIGGNYPKNCYFSVAPYESEDIYYSYQTLNSKDCLDVTRADSCELGYWLIDCQNCYKSFFLQRCSNCLDCYFLYDCRNCQDCFGCTNLRNKQYYFFNQPFSKKEYIEKLKTIYLGNREGLREIKDKFEKFVQKEAIHRNLLNQKSKNCFGDNLTNCKDCYYAFRGINSENVRYANDFLEMKDSMDFTNIVKSTRCYESTYSGNGNEIKFSNIIRIGLSVEYSMECHNCEYLFGCVGLRSKKYHIFNRAYSPEDYWKLVDKIKTEMFKRGEYGEFFPLSMSLYPYNDTFTQIIFPLNKEQIEKIDGWWYEETRAPDTKGFTLVKAEELPEDIKDVDDSIFEKAIVCEKTGKPFRLIEKELDFYRKFQLPLPTIHPVQRILDRFNKINPYHLWQTTCSKCHDQIYTSCPPQKQKELKIYCERCYLKEVV